MSLLPYAHSLFLALGSCLSQDGLYFPLHNRLLSSHISMRYNNSRECSRSAQIPRIGLLRISLQATSADICLTSLTGDSEHLAFDDALSSNTNAWHLSLQRQPKQRLQRQPKQRLQKTVLSEICLHLPDCKLSNKLFANLGSLFQCCSQKIVAFRSPEE